VAGRRRVKEAGRRRPAPIVAVSGPSGAGKTRLLRRLIPALAARGLAVAVIKHTTHLHPLDRRGKDTEVLRRAGAVAAAIQGPQAMALFGPPRADARALAALLPPCDLVLAEGWKAEPLPRLEVHRRRVSRDFLCATDQGVLAVVGDEVPPRPLPCFGADEVEAVADFLVAWLARHRRSGRVAGSHGPSGRATRPAGHVGRPSGRGRPRASAT
jgi:molybdopterin-guanine dinucleotide biosynthesis adapter protein